MSCFCVWLCLCFLAADAVHDPADQRRTPEGSHQIIAVHKGADGPGGLGGDFGGQFLTLCPICALLAGDDLLIHHDAVHLALQKDGIALGDDGHDAAEQLAIQLLSGRLDVLQPAG